MKMPELGFGGSNSAYNLEKGPWVPAQPLGMGGVPPTRAAPELLAAVCCVTSSTQGVTLLSKALYPESGAAC